MTIKDMLGRSGVVSREDALKALDGRLVVPALPSEDCSLSSALGRILAHDIVAPFDQPAFDRSTMDGFAVRSSDTFGAAESRPALLSVAGDIPMGAMPSRGIGRGECMKIATGGALPEGADAVVMFEQTQRVDDRSIEVVKAVAPGENVSATGDDMRKGEAVFHAGHVIHEKGFDKMDRRILLTVIEKFDGGPVGIDTISAAVGEERDTLEDVYEPYLIQEGYLHRTPRGRVATRLAYEHFNLTPRTARQMDLLGGTTE